MSGLPDITHKEYERVIHDLNPSGSVLNQNAGPVAWMQHIEETRILSMRHRAHGQPGDGGPSACNTCYWNDRGMDPPQGPFTIQR